MAINTIRKRNNKRNKRSSKAKTFLKGIILIIVLLIIAAVAYRLVNPSTGSSDLASLRYDGEIAVEINGNKPEFTDDEIDRAKKGSFEDYSKLDRLGRCGAATACLGKETMPAEGQKRESIYMVHPSGWQSISFWSRCHLIGYQLSAENANERNLITGTNVFNVQGMLPYENQVADYLRSNSDKHVLMKVEPVYKDDELVASGVQMQAWSVEDKGKSVSYNVYVFNIQPGYIIDYADGTVEDDPDHQTVITLENKKASYTGKPISIDEAKVSGSTGEVKYIYYTDANRKNKTAWKDGAEDYGMPPANKGTYYVVATVAGDAWYPSAASDMAVLTIK